MAFFSRPSRSFQFPAVSDSFFFAIIGTWLGLLRTALSRWAGSILSHDTTRTIFSWLAKNIGAKTKKCLNPEHQLRLDGFDIHVALPRLCLGRTAIIEVRLCCWDHFRCWMKSVEFTPTKTIEKSSMHLLSDNYWRCQVTVRGYESSSEWLVSPNNLFFHDSSKTVQVNCTGCLYLFVSWLKRLDCSCQAHTCFSYLGNVLFWPNKLRKIDRSMCNIAEQYGRRSCKVNEYKVSISPTETKLLNVTCI